MGTVKTSLFVAGIVLGASAWAGCSAGSEEDISSVEGAATGSTCQILDRQTGQPITDAKFKALLDKKDPIAEKVLKGECKTNFDGILTKLKTNDKDNCQNGPQGVGSYLISETAAFESKSAAANNGFRTVITKDCEGRGQNGMLFSSFANKAQHGEEGIEMIGRSTDGVFNYYELNGDGSYTYFGDSKDFITNGYTCDDKGFCASNNGQQVSSKGNGAKSPKACSSCHISGGLLMKELASPWLHWTAGFPNGSEDVVKANKAALGEQQIGENLEFQVVRASFDNYNEARVDILAAKGAEELLRPVMCTLDVNLDSQLGGSSLVSDEALGFGFLSMDDGIYQKLKKSAAVKQSLTGVPGKDDTAFEFTYPRRGAIDENYTQKLQARGLLTDQTIADLLAVDFTRPVFSGKRCALIKNLPKTADADLAAYAALPKDKKEAAAKKIAPKLAALFGNKLGSKTKAQHGKDLEAFFKACNDRLGSTDEKVKEKAHLDIMTYASNQRRKMISMRGTNSQRRENLIEDPSTMLVSDKLPESNLALNPSTCELDEN
jgi:hypothetical protein